MYLPRQICLKHRGHKYWDSETVLENHVWGDQIHPAPTQTGSCLNTWVTSKWNCFKSIEEKKVLRGVACHRGQALKFQDKPFPVCLLPPTCGLTCELSSCYTSHLSSCLQPCHHRNNLWNHKPRTLSRLFWSLEFYHSSNLKITKADSVTSKKEINTTQSLLQGEQ